MPEDFQGKDLQLGCKISGPGEDDSLNARLVARGKDDRLGKENTSCYNLYLCVRMICDIFKL